MELTLDQALQKGIEAHKAGKVEEADRYYTAILKSNPKHPDANHNMGVLAVGVGKVEQALPFFKTARDANPSTAQYWLSYIDALIKLDRIADAKAVFDQAKIKGAKGNGFDQNHSFPVKPFLASSPAFQASPPAFLSSLSVKPFLSSLSYQVFPVKSFLPSLSCQVSPVKFSFKKCSKTSSKKIFPNCCSGPGGSFWLQSLVFLSW